MAYEFPDKIFWIIIFTIISFIIIKIFDRIFNKETNKPEFIKYKRDKFLFWIWKWEYNWDDNVWRITNLKPYCPKCETPFINRTTLGENKVECPRCHEEYDNGFGRFEYSDSTEALILDNIEIKLF